MNLIKGKSYQCNVRLGFLESAASNGAVMSRFENAGFANVVVTGSGRNRNVIGKWDNETMDTSNSPIPSQIDQSSIVCLD